ncbi:hypothetical protein MIS45_10725 [Wielerella bovis]|uniref:hypothetical protein n=1 Tax=Wielerella bovis TaxID=2917790 RepID=UPI002019430F|nr:hypothetical protein [Wielerella bovis]ULJ69196.1 hypothetical protein MIS45_10725 [Wielerella bovis]
MMYPLNSFKVWWCDYSKRQPENAFFHFQAAFVQKIHHYLFFRLHNTGSANYFC